MSIRVRHISLFTLCCFALTGFAVITERTTAIDQTIIFFIQNFENPILTNMMKFFTLIGSFPFTVLIFLVVAAVFLYKKYYQDLILLSFVIAVSPFFNQMLKHFFKRERPEFHRLIDISGFSFPSGHTMNATSFYGIMMVLLWLHFSKKRHRFVIVLINSLVIFFIAISRVYLGAHYPSDIIGGIFASAFLISITIQLFPSRKEEYE